ncbi:MAG: GatB/YqeY domain-containing protein [Patescibacteria group bacterium]|nr:GatB/YqeY domain-containing protein [Patescibacteria group bacterium]
MLKEQINSDIKEFLKAGKSFEAGVLRLMSAALGNKEIEKRGKGEDSVLTDEEIVEVLMKEAKKRKEAAEVYKTGNREDLAEKELKELEVIKKYLPEQASAEEIEKAVDKAIAATGAVDVKTFGKVMAEVMKELKGKADAGTISEIIKKKLEMRNEK